MTTTEPAATDRLQLLREPFPAHQISKLPKPYNRDSPKAKCTVCDGYHGLPAVHLDYVGHAALTDRLLDVDPAWSWEPVAFGPDGLPQLDKVGGLWIRLTICGVTRLGYGDSQGKTGPNAVKEAIGDALRNAGMRFGAALDLWHKGDLHAADDDDRGTSASSPAPTSDAPQAPAINLAKLAKDLDACTDLDGVQRVFRSLDQNASNYRATWPMVKSTKERISIPAGDPDQAMLDAEAADYQAGAA